MRILVVLLCLALVGCSTTFTHPVTHQTVTCRSGGWVGYGVVGLSIAAAGNVLNSVIYYQCLKRVEAAGFIEDPKPPVLPMEHEREH